jgi:HTH-type transcriptional regulator/antitoxin HigA
MNGATQLAEYAAVVSRHPPRIIRSEAENERCTAVLEELDQRYDDLSRAEREFAELLTLLIEDFESKHSTLPKASPVDVVRFLMEQHELRQKDLLDVFGSASVASEVLSGKRELSKEHIRRLADRFSVPVDLLF